MMMREGLLPDCWVAIEQIESEDYSSWMPASDSPDSRVYAGFRYASGMTAYT